MITQGLTWDGGSLMHPDTGAIMSEETFEEYATFHQNCFDKNGVWKPEILNGILVILLCMVTANKDN